MDIISLDQINTILPSIDIISVIEEGFCQYAAGETVVPPVGEMILEKGEVHIKYGYVKEDAFYVIKIASGFYGNLQLGLPSGNGMLLLFSQQTGQPVAILLDEGVLTDIRTAAAGAIAAKYFAPEKISRIGIVGTGTQACLQLQYLRSITACRDVLVWGRGNAQLLAYSKALKPFGYQVKTTNDISEVQQTCNLIVTTTPAEAPLLQVSDLKPGTHITAVGSDTPEKQELDPQILARADVVIADSISQCLVRGEISHAIKNGLIVQDQLIELAQVIKGRQKGRQSENQTTVVDLTGVAVQDIAIATAVYKKYLSL